VGAIVLIALGALFLINTVANFPLWWLNRYWVPAALIALGVWVFVRKRTSSLACPCSRCLARCAMGPALLITTGTLWLLDDLTRWTFDRSWPVYLIVIGGILVLRHSASDEGHVSYAERLRNSPDYSRFVSRAEERMNEKKQRMQEKMDRFEAKMNRFHERVSGTEPDANAEVKTGPDPGGPGDEVHNG
jgi:hypothetical protein